ncbi:MAG: XRE family transcriptional regulator [Clostridia bacterium]|nr:XRE family transcriptional regulator [Clostridia bacterium]
MKGGHPMTEEELKLILAQNLIDYLDEQRKTTADLARTLNLPYSTVADWTHGKKFPRASYLCAIADALNITVAELVSTEDERPVPEELIGPYIKREDFIRVIEKLSPGSRAVAEALAEELLRRQ